ncbi:MAG: hypothetical protein ACJ8R9_14705 [Steroidobacteraceae bacterium]
MTAFESHKRLVIADGELFAEHLAHVLDVVDLTVDAAGAIPLRWYASGLFR